jgi:hypothetical protein
MIRSFSKLEIKRNFLNFIKNTYERHISNITLNGLKLGALLLGSEIKQECVLPPSYSIVLGRLAISANATGTTRHTHA